MVRLHFEMLEQVR